MIKIFGLKVYIDFAYLMHKTIKTLKMTLWVSEANT